jgi:hypothetical protein
LQAWQFLAAGFRRFLSSIHVTPDSLFPHGGLRQGSFATFAWLLA